MAKMKPCPFCGRENPILIRKRNSDGWRDWFYVLCDYDLGGCGASGQWNHSIFDAVNAWNRRVGIDSADESSLIDLLSEFAVAKELCNVCPFDGGGVVDCVGQKLYKKCIVARAIDVIKAYQKETEE